ncbi:Cys-Gln thioester bond-forming surface protein [Natronoglycomyces albus]|uniref:Cys-Gln thioester bond-forming surface protein n=1 Tax=Natronoglycomyces albus TaxID=2811108 RepID=A0A895XR54_9ACTN|nr:Cys-Gln thioester bond-forming surface protein [Natronoglycomyces albus]QSB04750.1 Cys-Gln thioester bond-forming surface protein [Natronoglycomyces albus]
MKRQMFTSTGFKGAVAAMAAGALVLMGAGDAAAQNGDDAVRTNNVEPITGEVETKPGYTLRGDTGDGPFSLEAKIIGLFPEGSSGNDMLLTYCIDIHTLLNEDLDYMEGTWEESEVPNLELVRWVLFNGYPNASVESLFDHADFDAPTDWDNETSVKVAYAGTQAAVWNLTDDFELNTEDPVRDGAEDVAEAIVGIYEYLLDNAAPLPDPSDYFIELDGFDEAVYEDGRFGPYWINSTAGPVTLEADGGSLETENGDSAVTVDDGERFYITLQEGATEIVIHGHASFDLPIGRVFMAITPEEAASSNHPQVSAARDASQKLILAQPREGELPAEWAFKLELPDEEPAPRLPVTGTSLTWLFTAGTLLLLGGIVALVVMRRRTEDEARTEQNS